MTILVDFADVLAGAVEFTRFTNRSFAEYENGFEVFNCYADGEICEYNDSNFTENEAIKIIDRILDDVKKGELTLADGVIVDENGDYIWSEKLIEMYNY